MAFFVVAGRPGGFATLGEAVAAAGAGDEVVVRGDGPFRTPAVRLRGKRLTVRAAPGCMPTLERAPGGPAWQPLLASDRELTLEGLRLRDKAGDDPVPLVCGEGAALVLRDCALHGHGPAPLIVLRGGPGLCVEGCRLDGEQVAVSIEVGGDPCRVALRGSRVTVRAPSGAAVSLWAAEAARPAPAALALEDSSLTAGRIVALRGLPAPVRIDVARNHFVFRAAVLGLDDYPGPDGWRRAAAWYGHGNRYRPAGSWLTIDGAPGPVRDLDGWQRLWRPTAESSDPFQQLATREPAPG